MKKLLAVSVFVCCAAFLLFLPGCSAPNVEQKQDHGKSYAEIMNEKLVSFTDCANAFSDSSIEESRVSIPRIAYLNTACEY